MNAMSIKQVDCVDVSGGGAKMSDGPLLAVFPGANRIDEVMQIVAASFEVRGNDPFNVRIGEQLCLVWLLKDPVAEGLFDDEWRGVDFELDDTVLAIDFEFHDSAVTLVKLLHATFGGFIVNTNFGEICSAGEFLSKYPDGSRVWTDE
jgi:hypothetical protein